MARAQAGRCLSAVFGAVILAGLSGAAQGQDSCQLLVFQPGQTDGEVSDTAPVQGSVCYALGVAPGQEVDVALTYGGEARFSIAGLVQDQRRFEFRAERSLYEIRVHQASGATDVEPFVLAIHAEPLPLPEPPAASSPPAFEGQETAEAPSDVEPTQTADEPDATSEAASPQPGPSQQVATQATETPEPADAPTAPADPVSVDLTPPPPEERVYGPGWVVHVDADGSAARVEGTATDYVSRFAARCDDTSVQGVHISLTGDPGFVLSRIEGSSNPVRLAVTGNDGTVQIFEASLAYQPAAAAWQSSDPLPTTFLQAFSDGALMTVRSASDRSLATFILYGVEEARAALEPLCLAGATAAPDPAPASVTSAADTAASSDGTEQAAVGATPAAAQEADTITSTPAAQNSATSIPAPAGPVLAAVEATPVPTGLTQVPPLEERTFGAGWSVTEGENDVVVVGTATDYLTMFQGYCDVNLPAGIHVTMAGPSMPGLSRSESAATAVRVEVTANDGSVQSFTTALTYRAAQNSWRSGLPLSTGFVDVFTRGAIMKVVTDSGMTVATFVLAGLEQAREPMTKICASGTGLAQSAAATVSAAPLPQTPTRPATPAAPATPIATTDPEAPDGWEISTEGGGVVTRGLAVDGVSVLQARCGTGLPPGVHLTLNGDPHGRLQRGGTQPVRIEITDDDQAPEVFNTVLAYQDAARHWVSQLPLPSSFAYAFGHGVIMKIFTADNVPAATFILFGTAEARDRMRAVCGF